MDYICGVIRTQVIVFPEAVVDYTETIRCDSNLTARFVITASVLKIL